MPYKLHADIDFGEAKGFCYNLLSPVFVLDAVNQCPMTTHLCTGRATSYAFWAKVEICIFSQF